MNSLDSILSGDEPIVQMISHDMGILAAENFVDMFNNACLQFAGFENYMTTLPPPRSFSLAPIANLSAMEH